MQPAVQPDPPVDPTQRLPRGVTLRAVALGSLLAAGNSYWVVLSETHGRNGGSAAPLFMTPVFMLFIFGITSFASTMFIHSNMLNAAREAARRMSVTEASFLPHVPISRNRS